MIERFEAGIRFVGEIFSTISAILLMGCFFVLLFSTAAILSLLDWLCSRPMVMALMIAGLVAAWSLPS